MAGRFTANVGVVGQRVLMRRVVCRAGLHDNRGREAPFHYSFVGMTADDVNRRGFRDLYNAGVGEAYAGSPWDLTTEFR